MPRIIPLGSIVKDLVTGFIGVAENRATYLYGCDRYCVQPKVDDKGEIPKSCMVDEPQLVILEDQEPVMPEPIEPKKLVKLGQLTYDPVSQIEGIVDGRSVYLNGCSRVHIAPPKDKDGKPSDGFWMDEKGVIGRKSFLGKDKLIVDAETEPKPEAKKSTRTGGPAPHDSKR